MVHHQICGNVIELTDKVFWRIFLACLLSLQSAAGGSVRKFRECRHDLIWPTQGLDVSFIRVWLVVTSCCGKKNSRKKYTACIQRKFMNCALATLIDLSRNPTRVCFFVLKAMSRNKHGRHRWNEGLPIWLIHKSWFARWRLMTTSTARILQGLSFLDKLGLFLFEPRCDYQMDADSGSE